MYIVLLLILYHWLSGTVPYLLIAPLVAALLLEWKWVIAELFRSWPETGQLYNETLYICSCFLNKFIDIVNFTLNYYTNLSKVDFFW